MAAWILLAASSAWAADAMRICLNWAPGADHAPFYFARSEGWFAAAGLAVGLVPGGGSADALGRLEAGDCEAAVADLGAVVAARERGRDPLAVYSVFSESPLAFYARAPVRLEAVADVTGTRIAADDKELARRLWPRLARMHGVDPDSVTWVPTPNNAKVEALLRGDAEVAANTFYHHRAEFEAAFGPALRVLHWRDFGVNPYGNALVVRERFAMQSPAATHRLVAAVQRAYLACAADAGPCLAALLAANPHLDAGAERAKWRAAAPLVSPAYPPGGIAGAFDAARVAKEHGTAAPAAFTNRFLGDDTSDPFLALCGRRRLCYAGDGDAFVHRPR